MAQAKKDIGEIVLEHKMHLIIVLVLVLVGVLAGGGIKVYTAKKEKETLSKIYSFRHEKLKKLSDKKMSAEQYVGELKKLCSEYNGSRYLFPLLMDSADELVKQEKLNESLTVLQSAHDIFKNENEYMNYFISIRLVAVFEDLKREDDAIKLLEELNSSPLKLLAGKNYLDLGRMYLRKGNTEKAKENLQYVVDNFGSDEFAKLAKAYLSDMNI